MATFKGKGVENIPYPSFKRDGKHHGDVQQFFVGALGSEVPGLFFVTSFNTHKLGQVHLG